MKVSSRPQLRRYGLEPKTGCSVSSSSVAYGGRYNSMRVTDCCAGILLRKASADDKNLGHKREPACTRTSM